MRTHAIQSRLGFWAVVGLLLLGGCCSIDQDPHYNRYAPHNGRRPLLKQVDHAVDQVHRALDNCDRRFDNAVY
jgi:hypothetical protein